MENVVNLLLFEQFELVNLFVYGVQYLKKTEKLDFPFIIPLNFELLITEQDFVTRGVVLRLDSLIMSLFLEFLGVMKVFLVNGHQFSDLEG